MAKIKQGILGGFSGKVANVVGTSWKGRAVMKSQPLSVANPRTESQVGQRNKFSKIAELASQILTQFVQPVENPISGNISGYNLFCKDNKTAFDAAGDLTLTDLVAGGGKIINLESPIASGSALGSYVSLDWTNSGSISAIRLTDKVYAVAIRENGEVLGVLSGTKTRTTGHASINFFDGVEPLVASEKIGVLFACVSADGRDVSIKTAAIEMTVS